MKKGLFGISVMTVTFLYGILAAVLICVFAFCKLPIAGAVAIVIAVMFIQFLIGPRLTDFSMKHFYKAKFTNRLPQYLSEFIKTVCAEKKMKLPKIGYIDDGAPNAFTYGRTKNSARIILTRGIFDILSEEEVKAVVAHELGHACHYDMLLMTALQAVPLALYAIAQACLDNNKVNQRETGGDNGGEGGANYTAIAGAAVLVIYAITQYMILWFSRAREYYADEFSARVTKNPNALASALVKIGFGLVSLDGDNGKRQVSKASALGISDVDSSKSIATSIIGEGGRASKTSIQNAMKWDLWNTWAKWYELHSTHPLIAKRILAISDYSKKYGQEPFVRLDQKRPKSNVGRFVGEFALMSLPCVAGIAAIVAVAMAFVMELKTVLLIIGTAGLGTVLISLAKYAYRHPKGFGQATVAELLGEVDVSDMGAIPCVLSGELIGRGDPGCIFNENFVLRDETGIILLNYKQPIRTLNKLFALFRSDKYINKRVTVKGWFRRSPVPYVDILSMKVENKVKRLRSYVWGYIARCVLLVLFLLIIALYFIA